MLEDTLGEVGTLWGLNPVSAMQDAMSGKTSFSFGDLLLSFAGELLGRVTENITVLITVVGIVYVTSLMLSVYEPDHAAWGEAAMLAVVAVIAVPIVRDVIQIASMTADTMGEMTALMLSSIPALATMGMTAGSGMFLLITQVVGVLLKTVFLPLSLLYGALGITDVISVRFRVEGVKNMVRSIFNWGLGIMMIVFTCVSSVSGALSGSFTSAGSKTLKYLAGSMVPVVGRYLSESADMVFASANLMKNAAGIGIMAALLVLCLLPFAKMIAYVLLYRLAGVLIQPVASDRICKLLTAAGDTLSMLMGLSALMGVMCIMNTAIFVSVAV